MRNDQKTSKENAQRHHNCVNLVADKGKPTQPKRPAHTKEQREVKGQDSCRTQLTEIPPFIS